MSTVWQGTSYHDHNAVPDPFSVGLAETLGLAGLLRRRRVLRVGA